MKSKALNIVAVVALILMIVAAVAIIGSFGDRGEPIGDHTHAYKVVSNTATCETAGEKVEICTICEAERRSDAVALGHNLVVVSHVEPTCVGNGTHNTKCTRCEYTESEVLKAIGHIYVLSEEKSSTCTEGGVRVEVCVTCNAESYETFEPTEHVLRTFEALAPTCTSVGYDAYTVCKNCSYTTRGEDIPALGHDEVAHEAVASTCNTHGNEAYVTCSRCDYTTFKELPLGEHSYAERICSACGRAEPILEGTWKFNRDSAFVQPTNLPFDEYGEYTEYVKFSSAYLDNKTMNMQHVYFDHIFFQESKNLKGQFTVDARVEGTDPEMYLTYPYNIRLVSPGAGWLTSTAKFVPAVFFGAEGFGQTVSEEFYDWFVANATKVVAE